MKTIRILILAGLLGGAAGARAGERALVDTVRSPDARMYMPDLGDARWTGGLWADRFAVCRTTMIPHMWEIFQSAKDSHAWDNFLIAAGMGRGLAQVHQGPPFADGDFFKWLEGVAQVYAITRDPDLDRLMDRIIAVVARAQRADGYLGTMTTIAQLTGKSGAREFVNRDNFETYNLGHLMTAGCVHYRATGKTSLLEVARKAADYLYRFYQTASPELARNAICPSHYMGVVEMYRTTRDPRYLELARQMIEIRGEVKNGEDQNQDRVPFRDMTKAVGHAVRANYLYAGVADVVAETGDAGLLRTLRLLGDDVADHKLYVTGATGALYDGASPDGSANNASIQLVHQAYGRDFQLPNLTAYNESCATVGYMLWNWRMLETTGDARYADLFEQSLYNGLLAAISLEGKDYFYVNPLRKVRGYDWPLRWSRTRRPNIQSSFCCPPNVVRTIAEAQDYIYSLSPGALWVNLYGASRLDTAWADGSRIRVVQETDYPWSGAIRLKIEQAPDGPVALRFRIPGWIRPGAASAALDGRRQDLELKPGTYAEIRRVWRAGDELELRLDFAASVWEANPLVEDTLNQVAVKYGPLVYCLESNDLPSGVRLTDVALSASDLRGDFGTERERIAGQELLALRVPAVALGRETGTEDGALYRRADAAPGRPIEVKLVPYFAWGNRGEGDMTVWLPVR
ncbi:MAG TPA: glycoside hydrolase family 127 protein [Opitutaceae bacterium]|nr:glycoside hydrolase family 127 protein [Opitutaceae bacterium]